MTSLHKLGLRGVRSYSSQSKTTIIESLKFATTGALPPLSDGGKSFVHDPKLEGTSLMKAQVKLSFRTADGKTVLAIRNFQLAQKKAKREFKGMEAVLSTKDENGRESSVSHKCADIEKLVPQLMGVSPAVLENVIFCIAGDTAITLNDGFSRPIRDVAVGTHVLSLDKVPTADREEVGFVAKATSALLDQGVKECVELLFSDGRTITCTPDHRFLAADGKWITAEDMTTGTTDITAGMEYPHLAPLVDADAAWELDLTDSLGCKLNVRDGLGRSLAFAGLLGYLLTAGRTSEDGSVLYPGHPLDAQAIVRDIHLLTGIAPTASRDGTAWTINFPAQLHQAMLAVGASVADRLETLFHFPAFLMSPTCPVPVVQAFIGGLFGGGGKAPSLAWEGNQAQFAEICFSLTPKGSVQTDQTRVTTEEMQSLMMRCGIPKEALGESLSSNATSGVDPKESDSIEWTLSPSATLPFARSVGFRYCCHKQMRLTAACAYYRLKETLSRQKKFISDAILAEEAACGGRHLVGGESAHSELMACIKEAKAQLAKQENVHPDIMAWKPTELKDANQLGMDVHAALHSFDALKFFMPAVTDKAVYGVDSEVVLPTFRVRLIGKRAAGSKATFDLSVPGTENFIANGLTSHNCHQEDSLWPLSDAKTLKLKFDDIFAATRYTKALENIAKLRKEKASEIKVMEVELKSLEGNVDQAHKLEDDLEQAKENIAKKTAESDRIGEEVKVLEQKLAKLGVKQDEIRQVQDLISTLQAQKDVMIAEKTKANQRMVTDYSDTDEELKAIYQNFCLSQKQLVASLEAKINRAKQLEADCVRSESAMGKLNEDLGKLAAHEQDYRRKQHELSELATRLGAVGSDHAQLVSTLTAAKVAKEAELTNAKRASRELDAKSENELTNMKSEENSIIEQIRAKTAQMEACKSKRGDLVSQITKLDSASRQLAQVHDQLKSSQSQLDSLLRTIDPDTIETKSKIDTKMRQIQSNTQKLSVLSNQRKQLASQAEILAQIKLKRSQVQNMLAMYNTDLDSLRRDLSDARLLDASLFPHSLPNFDGLAAAFGDSADDAHRPNHDNYKLDKLEQALKRNLTAIRTETANKTSEMTASTAQVSSLQSQRKGFEDQLRSLKKQLDSHRNDFIAAECEVLFTGTAAQLEEEIVKANKIFEKASNEQMLGNSARLLYKKFISIAKESHKCHLCNREFADSTEESQFVSSNTDKMDRLVTADKSERNKAATKAAKLHLEQMQALMPIFTAAQQIRQQEIPRLESQILQLESDIAVANSRKSTVELELKDSKEREDQLGESLRTTGTVSRLGVDLQHMFHGLRVSEKKLSAESVDVAGGRNLEVVTNEYEAIEKLNVTLQHESNILQEKLESMRSEKQKLIEKVNQLRENAASLTRSADDKERLRKEEADNIATYTQLKQEYAALRDRLPLVKSRISDVSSTREEDRRRSTTLEQQLQQELAAMQQQLMQFQTIIKEIDKYERQLEDRTAMKVDLTKKQDTLNAMRVERAELSKEIAADQARAQQNEKIDVDIKANLDYREREAAIVAHQKKIDERTAHLRSISGGELLDDLRHLQTKLSKYKEKRSELRGSMNAQAQQCEELITNLTSERFRHIDARYKEKLVDVKTHQLANQDLETYHRALDRALMHYHSLKMKEINETLKDYWRTVYKGSDIDEISIQSDGAVIGSRRNYNYRVVMKQGDTELDMRGRCSAGQKVLASLLIRLALADTFCSQCSVLALDEPVRHAAGRPTTPTRVNRKRNIASVLCWFDDPHILSCALYVCCACQTTNLDHKNITAFAQALNQIIERRRDQSNFQLIIITHDETFVDILGRKSHTDYYYRVYKDNAQQSKIRKQVIEAEEEH